MSHISLLESFRRLWIGRQGELYLPPLFSFVGGGSEAFTIPREYRSAPDMLGFGSWIKSCQLF